jgi:hypothetical protein
MSYLKHLKHVPLARVIAIISPLDLAEARMAATMSRVSAITRLLLAAAEP